MLVRRCSLALALLFTGCATQPPASHTPAPLAPANSKESPDAEQEKMLLDAWLAIDAGMPQAAIDNQLDPIIATFEQRWGHSKQRVYSARTAAEATFSMLESASRHENSIALGPVWSIAYELKAYALFELGRMTEARAALDKALALAPHNAKFLLELGAQYETEKNWDAAMKTFQQAEEAAKTFSPPQLRNDELAHAWRGQAYVYVELGNLDEAERLYRRCLDLDKDDKRAAVELEYVRKKRAETASK